MQSALEAERAEADDRLLAVRVTLRGQGSALPRELTDTARYLKQCERHPEGDRIIDGDLCQLYQVTHEGNRSRFWIDDQARFRRYEEEHLVDGLWQAEELVTIAYGVAVDPNWITPRFEPGVRVIEPGAMLKTRYRLDSALARREVLGLHFAVHEVQRSGPHTPDLGGTATTQDVTAAVMDALPQSLAV